MEQKDQIEYKIIFEAIEALNQMKSLKQQLQSQK